MCVFCRVYEYRETDDHAIVISVCVWVNIFLTMVCRQEVLLYFVCIGLSVHGSCLVFSLTLCGVCVYNLEMKSTN